MKRFLVVASITLAMSFCLTACGDKPNGDKPNIVIENQFDSYFSVHDCRIEFIGILKCLFTNKTNQIVQLGYGHLEVEESGYDSRNVKIESRPITPDLDPNGTSEIVTSSSANKVTKIILAKRQ
jgi:hypothetical protein